MNPELAMAKCRHEELKLKAKELEMQADEVRHSLREATAPFVPCAEIDTARVLLLTAMLVKAITDLRAAEAEMSKLQREYSL